MAGASGRFKICDMIDGAADASHAMILLSSGCKGDMMINVCKVWRDIFHHTDGERGDRDHAIIRSSPPVDFPAT